MSFWVIEHPSIQAYPDTIKSIKQMAERVGFEPTVHLLGVQPISSRPRYSRFGTSPFYLTRFLF